ncbi:MAG: hypothetical protein C4294_02135 [Nitrospiraceae bacterium]
MGGGNYETDSIYIVVGLLPHGHLNRFCSGILESSGRSGDDHRGLEGHDCVHIDEQEVIPNNVSEYVHGKDQVLPKLKAALTGMKTGERKRIDLQPDEAFGPYDEQKMMRVRRDESPPTARTGSVYQTPHGEPFTVVALSESTAVIDFNHPLAGKHLVLDVEVLRVEHPS